MIASGLGLYSIGRVDFGNLALGIEIVYHPIGKFSGCVLPTFIKVLAYLCSGRDVTPWW